jgi:NitT/TauT family transport system substrate-binding protein
MERRRFLTAAAAATLPATASPAQARPTIRIARIQGINFLPTYLMQRRRLVETHAERLGLPGAQAEWIDFPGGGNATDAMLAGAVDVVNAGPGNMLLLWDRTRGGVKGIVSNSALPATLVSRDPRLKAVTDYGPDDRIAVPTVLVSTQAILLQIAAEKAYGADQWRRFNANAVQLGHGDAYGAMMNPSHEIRSHFASPPFITRELHSVRGAHVVTSSAAILGSPLSTAVMFTTTRFAEQQPVLVKAIAAASAEAIATTRGDPGQAARDYLDASGDRIALAELVPLLGLPDMVFDIKPEGTLRFAEFLNRIGTLRTRPKAWTEYFLPDAAALGGS